MKKALKYSIFIIIIFFLSLSCVSHKSQLKSTEFSYNKDSILTVFADYLNSYINNRIFKYEYKNNICFGFGVIDLTDTTNTTKNHFYLKELHIYVFAPLRKKYGYNNVAILNKGKIKIFKAINCKEKGDKIESVTKYVEDSLPRFEQKNIVLNRILRCREYGRNSIMRRLNTDDEDLIYDTFDCFTNNKL